MNNTYSHDTMRRQLTQICFVASASLIPSNLKKDSSCFATPIPAEPAPKNRMRCSVSGLPETWTQYLPHSGNPTVRPSPCLGSANTELYKHQIKTVHPERLTSSLKQRYFSRKRSRYLNALSVEKSSNCTSRLGKTSFMASMNSSMNSSIYSSHDLVFSSARSCNVPPQEKAADGERQCTRGR